MLKIPKTTQERTILLPPPAQAALKILLVNAEELEPLNWVVKVNRHESRIDRVRLLLSPKNQAWRKVVNDWFMPTT